MNILRNLGFELVDMEKVKENDCNLVVSVYRKSEESKKYELISLADLLIGFESGCRPKGVTGITEGAISLGAEHIGSNGKVSLNKIKYLNSF